MKKTIFLCILGISFITENLNAQRYSINKLKYDYHQYVPEMGDPYNPVVSGVCSLFVPGLGQIVSGEVGRGLVFLGGYFVSMYMFGFGIAFSASNYEYDSNTGIHSSTHSPFGPILLGLGTAGLVGGTIWSIVDAVHVAKVNNMYIRSLRKTSSVHFEVAPYVTQLSINNQLITPVGMTMRVKF
jgi:TM2 domain-containing membrane protein YozV